MLPESITTLKQRLRELAHLRSVLAMLSWDKQVNMPKNGASIRAETTSYLAGIAHEKFIDINADDCLEKAKKLLDKGKLNDQDSAVVREVWRDYLREQQLPANFIIELAKTTSEAHHIWAKARANNDFALFLPYLEKIIQLKQKEAEYVGYIESPYDALIDSFEPDMKASELTAIFAELKQFLVPLVKKIQASKYQPDAKQLKGEYPIDKQIAFNIDIAKAIGYDFDSGRVDTSTHPFTQTFHPQDVRITTRYDKHNLFYAINTTTHEVGHALYEQGLPYECFGTPLAESISLGVHESQSKLWENHIGLSRPFWKFFYPKLCKTFPEPFKDIPFDEFYFALNQVKPTLIRTEADEVTYNLHIIMRFEIEKALIEGSLKAADLPTVWNAKVQELLGIDVPSDSLGVLQDVHWSAGYFGYFPTYALGTLYAAQFDAALQNTLPHIRITMAKGNFQPIRRWLLDNIHRHGRFYGTKQLIKQVTGEDLSATFFTDYISSKYTKLYQLDK